MTRLGTKTPENKERKREIKREKESRKKCSEEREGKGIEVERGKKERERRGVRGEN